MTSISRRLASLFLAGAGVSLAIALLVLGREKEPCLGTYMGARVSLGMLDIGQTTASLGLLTEDENPKLRRLLEGRLVTAVRDARKALDHDPVMEPVSLPTMVPNWKTTVQRAKAYVVDHHLDDSQFLKVIDADLRPTEDLAVLEAWLATQPDGSQGNR
jgi:hypothetical protein